MPKVTFTFIAQSTITLELSEEETAILERGEKGSNSIKDRAYFEHLKTSQGKFPEWSSDHNTPLEIEEDY